MEALRMFLNNKPMGDDHQHVPAATVSFFRVILSCQQLPCCNNTDDSFQSFGSSFFHFL